MAFGTYLRLALPVLISALPAGCGSQAAYPGASVFTAPKPTYDGYLAGLVRIPVDGEKTVALWVPADGARTAILYFHAEGEDLGSVRYAVREIARETGCAVLAPELPGYGIAPGSFSETACAATAAAALDFLSFKYGYKASDVVVFGRSLGAAVAADLAVRRPPKGLALVSPFASLARTFRAGVDAFASPDRFDNVATMRGVVCPLFVAHGDADEVIPFSQGREVFDAAASKDKVFVSLRGMRHNDALSFASAAAYWDGIRRLAGASGV